MIYSSSSSPLLSLVQVPAKLAINLSIHTQHTYDNGVDRTGRQGMEEKYSIYMRRGRRKKKLTPRPCSIGSTVWEQKKNTSAQKHIYHRHNLQQGETYPALASSHPVRCHLRRRSQTCSTAWRYKAFRGSLVGGGEYVCDRGGNKIVPLQCSFPGIHFQQRPCRAVLVRRSQKIRLRFV